jgi:hypothetical protein
MLVTRHSADSKTNVYIVYSAYDVVYNKINIQTGIGTHCIVSKIQIRIIVLLENASFRRHI